MQYEEKKLRAETAPHHVILGGAGISVRIWGGGGGELRREQHCHEHLQGDPGGGGEDLHIKLSLDGGDLKVEGSVDSPDL